MKAIQTEEPCPFCGQYNGMHMWAGSGRCPGAEEPMVAMLRILRQIEQRLEAIERQLKVHLR